MSNKLENMFLEVMTKLLIIIEVSKKNIIFFDWIIFEKSGKKSERNGAKDSDLQTNDSKLVN